MNITIVGGGNIGTQFAVHCAKKGHVVTIYTSTPEVFDRYLRIVDENGSVILDGWIDLATNSPDEAFASADVILVTVPSNVMKGIAKIIYTYAPSDTIIGAIPGNGGVECAFKKCIEKGNTFFHWRECRQSQGWLKKEV